jgi:ribonuclease BN (tRNA processing enzyme)
MRRALRLWVLAGLVVGQGPTLGVAQDDIPERCGQDDVVAVQVLGSGGPELARGRASTSYLVWHRGRARVLVDLGAGAMLRFNQSGARLTDLALIALTHLHVDHAGDLPALVKIGYFDEREEPLPVAGPGPGPSFPGLGTWLDRQFAAGEGAYRYLSGVEDGTGGQFALSAREQRLAPGQVATVLDAPELRVEAIGVRHGPVPAVAFRVRLEGRTIVFAGDQDGETPEFWKFATSAQLLLAHLAIPVHASPAARALHATPTRLGEGAAASRAGHVLLSHLMTRSEARLDESLAAVREHYAGPVSVARDLGCFIVPAATEGMPTAGRMEDRT